MKKIIISFFFVMMFLLPSLAKGTSTLVEEWIYKSSDGEVTETLSLPMEEKGVVTFTHKDSMLGKDSEVTFKERSIEVIGGEVRINMEVKHACACKKMTLVLYENEEGNILHVSMIMRTKEGDERVIIREFKRNRPPSIF